LTAFFICPLVLTGTKTSVSEIYAAVIDGLVSSACDYSCP
jgi:hypothetical protein